MSKASELFRKTCTEGDTKRDEGLTTPSDVERFDDIVYGNDKKWQILDLYRPVSMKGKKLPVIVSFHGGGWVYGSKEVYQFYCMSLAEEGFAVLNFTYRLAPEVKFPAPLIDMNLVMRWMVENASKYMLDTDNVFAVGDSAGGHGLALYSDLYSNPDYAASFAYLVKNMSEEERASMNGIKGYTTLDDKGFHITEGFKLKAVGLNCGAYHLEGKKNDISDNTGDLMADYLPEQGTEKEYNLISTDRHVTAEFPPAFVMTCPRDFLKGQAHFMVDKFTELDVDHLYRFYSDKDRSLGHVFHANVKLKDAGILNKEECAFFKEHIG